MRGGVHQVGKPPRGDLTYPMCVDKAVEIGTRDFTRTRFRAGKDLHHDSRLVTENAASIYK